MAWPRFACVFLCKRSPSCRCRQKAGGEGGGGRGGGGAGGRLGLLHGVRTWSLVISSRKDNIRISSVVPSTGAPLRTGAASSCGQQPRGGVNNLSSPQLRLGKEVRSNCTDRMITTETVVPLPSRVLTVVGRACGRARSASRLGRYSTIKRRLHAVNRQRWWDGGQHRLRGTGETWCGKGEAEGWKGRKGVRGKRRGEEGERGRGGEGGERERGRFVGPTAEPSDTGIPSDRVVG